MSDVHTLDDNCCKCFDCDSFCNFMTGNTPEDLLTSIQNQELRTRMQTRVNDYNRRDKWFIYFTTLVATGTFIASMFAFILQNECESRIKPVRNLTVWMSCFSIFCCAIRIYFQREYILMPIVANFQLEVNDCYHKFMGIITALLACALAGNLAAVWSLASNGNLVSAIIAMCVLIGASFMTTLWYKRIVKRVTRLAIQKGIPVAVIVNHGV